MNRDRKNTPEQEQQRALTDPTHTDCTIAVLLTEAQKKEQLELKAYDALDHKLTMRKVKCRKCGGTGLGKVRRGEEEPEECPACDGEGSTTLEPEMKAIELVLGPKYPKSNININADVQNMSTEDFFRFIENM